MNEEEQSIIKGEEHPEEFNPDYKAKAVGQFKLQLGGVFQPFNLYGLGIYVPEAIEQVTTLALRLHDRLGGKDVPITWGK